MIDIQFNKSLEEDDIYSGLGEVLRLCITGGKRSLSIFESNISQFLKGNHGAMRK